MEFQVTGNPDFGSVEARLAPGETLIAESGAMSRMDADLDLRAGTMGGVLAGLARKLFGGESFFVGRFSGSRGGELALAPRMPGTVLHRRLDGERLMLTAGCFLAATPGITLATRFGGLKAFLSREGAFLLHVGGHGDLFFNAYGGIVEQQVDGSFTVDNGHVVAWTPELDYEIGGMGGIKQTLFSGEGLVMRFHGHGTVWLQTRTAGGLVAWLSPFCIG